MGSEGRVHKRRERAVVSVPKDPKACPTGAAPVVSGCRFLPALFPANITSVSHTGPAEAASLCSREGTLTS